MSATQEALKRIETAAGQFRQALEQGIPTSDRTRYLNILTTNLRDVERWLGEPPEAPVVDEIEEAIEPYGDD